MSSPTPVIFDDGSKAMVPAAQLSAALKDGGKVAQAMTFDDGSRAYVPLDRVHEAIHDGGQLIGTPPQAPRAPVQAQPLSWLEQRGAQTAANAVDAAKHVAPIASRAANDIYDVSAPGIATEVAKQLAGLPNNLKKLPAKMVMGWLAAGGLPEADVAEAATAKAAATPEALAPKTEAPVSTPAPAPTPAPTVTPSSADPLLERLRGFARDIEAKEKLKAATEESTPDPDEDLTPLLRKHLEQVLAQQAAKKAVTVQ